MPTWSAQFQQASGGSSASGTQEAFVSVPYIAIVAATGYAVGDIIVQAEQYDMSMTPPTWLSTTWRNMTQGITLASAPVAANIATLEDSGASSPNFTAVVGDPAGNFAGVRLIEAMMDDASGYALNARIVNPQKTDQVGNLILSDAPASINILGAAGQTVVIDTTGYESLNITTQLLTGSVSASDDMKSWQALSGTPRVLGGLTTTIAASSGYSFPCVARYIMITIATAGTATAYLRAQAWNGSYTTTVPTGVANNNVSQIGATAVVSAGVAGTLAVGGNTAAGVAPTLNPMGVAGVDSSGLSRRALMDASGRTQSAAIGIDQTATQRQLGLMPANYGALPQLAITDQSLTENLSRGELLTQLLLEVRITNQLLYSAFSAGVVDEPAAFRQDPSIFNQ